MKDGAVTEMVEAETKIKSKLILLEDGEQRSQGLIHVHQEATKFKKQFFVQKIGKNIMMRHNLKN